MGELLLNCEMRNFQTSQTTYKFKTYDLRIIFLVVLGQLRPGGSTNNK